MRVRTTQRFDPAASTVREARRFVGAVIAGWSLPPGDAELLVSELATNAVLHAQTAYEVAVSTVGPHGVRVTVTDDDPTLPVAGELGSHDALGGRGVALVGRLSKRWGCERTRAGKTVWFEV